MEQKELRIQIPEGYEIDKEKSTFENIVFKPIVKLVTYDTVCESLFKGKKTYFPASDGRVLDCLPDKNYNRGNYSTSKKQGEKLMAINMLMNVAKYLNEGWSPDLGSSNYNLRKRWFIYIGVDQSTLKIHAEDDSCTQGRIYFKTQEKAQEAIGILGEEVVRLALSWSY